MMNIRRKSYLVYLIAIILFLLIAFLCLYFSCNAKPIGSDNGNVFIESKIFLEEGFERSYNSLQAPIPVIINALFLSISYNFPLILISGIFSILITLVIFKILRIELGILVALLSLILFLLSPMFFERTWYLSPYPLSLFLVTLSIFLYVRVENAENKNSFLVIVSAFFMSLAVYSWTLALTMIAIPILFHIFSKSLKKDIRLILIYYSSILLFLIPWIIWHLKIGGIQHFYFNNYNWYSVKYLPIVNKYFWGYGGPGYSNISQLIDYYGNFLSTIWGNIFIGIGLLFSILGLVKINTRLRALCLSWIIVSILPLLGIQTATFARYFYFALPPFIILASYGLYFLVKSLNNTLRFSLVLLLLIVCFIQIPTYYDNFLNSPSNPSPNSASIQDVNVLKDTINDSKNIYSRHHAFQYYFPDNNFIAFSDMSEDDAISFLSWESETAISTIMEKYRIGWIMLYQDERWEKDYFIWVKEVTGAYTKHYIEISKSSNFEIVYDGNIYVLYRHIDNPQSQLIQSY